MLGILGGIKHMKTFFNILIFVLVFCACKESFDSRENLSKHSGLSYVYHDVRIGQDVQKYFSLVNQAEIFITEFEYKKADSLYKKAFNEYASLTKIKDAYNALFNSLHLNDIQLSEYYCRQLFSLNIDPKIIANDFLLPSIVEKMEEKGIPLNVNPNGYNEVLDLEIDKIVAADQHQYGNVGTSANFSKDISYQFINLLQDGLLPTQSSLKSSLSVLPKYMPVIRHSFQTGDTVFTHILLNSLQEGIISPEVFDFFYDSGNFNKPTHCLYSVSHKCEILKKKLPTDLELSINDFRDKIGLPSIKDLDKKVRFLNAKESNNNYKFLINICGGLSKHEDEFYEELRINKFNCQSKY